MLAEFDITSHGTVSPVCLCVKWCPSTIPKEQKFDLMGHPRHRRTRSNNEDHLALMLANTEPLAGINDASNSGEHESLLTQHVKEREERKRSALLSRQSARSRQARGESRSSSRGGALSIAQSHGYLASQVIQPLLVATVGEIIELDPSDGSPLHECPLQQTHCKGRLRALAIHPDPIREQYMTGGDDSTIRIWCARTGTLIKAKPLLEDHIAWISTLAYHPKGTVIAVGVCGEETENAKARDEKYQQRKMQQHKKDHTTGHLKNHQKKHQKDQRRTTTTTTPPAAPPRFPGRDFVYDEHSILRDKKSKLNGGWFILNEKDLSIVFRARDSLSSVTCTRFSPDGQVLAVASQDGQIYLYNSHSKDYSVLGR